MAIKASTKAALRNSVAHVAVPTADGTIVSPSHNEPPVDTVVPTPDTLATAVDNLSDADMMARTAVARSSLMRDIDWAMAASDDATKQEAMSQQTLAHAIMVLWRAIRDACNLSRDSELASWKNALVGPKAKSLIVRHAKRAFAGEVVSRPPSDNIDGDKQKLFEVYNAKATRIDNASKLAIALSCVGVTADCYNSEVHKFCVPVASLMPSRGVITWELRAKAHPGVTHVMLDGSALYAEVGDNVALKTKSATFKASAAHVLAVARHNFDKEDKAFATELMRRAPQQPNGEKTDGDTAENAERPVDEQRAGEVADAAKKAADATTERLQRQNIVATTPLAMLLATAKLRSNEWLNVPVLQDDQETRNILNIIEDLSKFATIVKHRIAAQKDAARAAKVKADNMKADRLKKEADEREEIARIEKAKADELKARELDQAKRTVAATASNKPARKTARKVA